MIVIKEVTHMTNASGIELSNSLFNSCTLGKHPEIRTFPHEKSGIPETCNLSKQVKTSTLHMDKSRIELLKQGSNFVLVLFVATLLSLLLRMNSPIAPHSIVYIPSQSLPIIASCQTMAILLCLEPSEITKSKICSKLDSHKLWHVVKTDVYPKLSSFSSQESLSRDILLRLMFF